MTQILMTYYIFFNIGHNDRGYAYWQPPDGYRGYRDEGASLSQSESGRKTH